MKFTDKMKTLLYLIVFTGNANGNAPGNPTRFQTALHVTPKRSSDPRRRLKQFENFPTSQISNHGFGTVESASLNADAFNVKNVDSDTLNNAISQSNPLHYNRIQRDIEFDLEQLRYLSERSLQLCPYSDFCFRNGSAIEENRWNNRISCCKDCYCDKGCGKRIDCCFDFLDDSNIVETNHLICTAPQVKKVSEVINDVEQPSKHYFMVDSCQDNSSRKCKNELSAEWGNLYPVYSFSKELIYYNRYCAACNGVNDTVEWDVYFACNFIDVLIEEGLINDLKNSKCEVMFRPPETVNVEKFVCDKNVIKSCNASVGGLRTNSTVEDACLATRAHVQDQTDVPVDVYANIFCKICNGAEHLPLDICKAPLDEFRAPLGSFVTLVDWKTFGSRLDADKSRSNLETVGKDLCKQFELKHPIKDDCRVISCPAGATRTRDGCTLYTKIWYQNGFKVHVILTPISGHLMPMETFNQLIAKPRLDSKKWLEAKGLKFDSVNVYVEIVTVQNTSYVRSLNMILGQSKYPLVVSEVLTLVELSLSKRWRIKLNGSNYIYEVKFDKYLYYIQSDHTQRKTIFDEKWLSEEPGKLPNVYEPVFHDEKLIFFHISKMYFCEQVELLTEEWIPEYQGLWLNLTNNPNKTYLGDGEFMYWRNPNGTWQVKICVDDFKAQFAPLVTNSATTFDSYVLLLICLHVTLFII